jgi:hypothetical protein
MSRSANHFRAASRAFRGSSRFGGVEFDLQAITVATQYAEINAPVVNDRERPSAVGQGSGFASRRLLHEVAETLLGANGIPAHLRRIYGE